MLRKIAEKELRNVECSFVVSSLEKNAKCCFAIYLPRIYNITLRKIFEVLCNFDIASAGWTVIQQRQSGVAKRLVLIAK